MKVFKNKERYEVWKTSLIGVKTEFVRSFEVRRKAERFANVKHFEPTK